MKVGLYTSISPTHVLGDIQQQAAASWIDAGIAYTTLNAYGEEITIPEGARAIVTNADARHLYGKPYIFIDDLLDLARRDEVDVAIITNSDIELVGDLSQQIAESEGAMWMGNRTDHDGDIAKGITYPHGFDIFIIHRDHFKHITPSLFVLGQTWWDYFVPWCMAKAKVPIRRIPNGTIAHRRHPIQYSTADWERMTDHFKFIANAKVFQRLTPSALTHNVFRTITRYAS
jgi:hypothetical protein